MAFKKKIDFFWRLKKKIDFFWRLKKNWYAPITSVTSNFLACNINLYTKWQKCITKRMTIKRLVDFGQKATFWAYFSRNFDVLEEILKIFIRFRFFYFSSKFEFFWFLPLGYLNVVFELASNFVPSVPTSKSHSLEILQSESRRNNLLASRNVVFRCRMTLLRPWNSS